MKALSFLAVAFALLSARAYSADHPEISAYAMDKDTLVVLDTQNKKLLLYKVSTTLGLSLVEVRSFEKMLTIPSQHFTPALTAESEEKAMQKASKEKEKEK